MTDRAEFPIGAPDIPPVAFSIAVEAGRDAAEIAPRGELDLATTPHLQHKLTELIDAGLRRIVVDLRGVEFLDSTGLHALLAAHAQAQQGNWQLTIVPGPPAVQRIFELTRTIDLLPFTPANGRLATPAWRE